MLSSVCTVKPCKPLVLLLFHSMWNHCDCTASIPMHCPFYCSSYIGELNCEEVGSECTISSIITVVQCMRYCCLVSSLFFYLAIWIIFLSRFLHIYNWSLSHKCDWIYENQSKSHMWYFKNYKFEIFNPLWVSCARM